MLRFLRFGVHKVRLPRKTLPDEKIFTNLPSDDWGAEEVKRIFTEPPSDDWGSDGVRKNLH